MTNETRERIKYYKNKLPHMKEKLTAAIMMLVIAATVTVTATYAWVTLSTAPEVTSIDTTVAANGSLEIALAKGTGAAPGNSKVGDSSAVERTGDVDAIVDSNSTWGNLVNLSSDSYGLGEIVLRPAALNGPSGLLSNPLSGVEYGEDGRISNMLTGFRFAYSYYDKENEKFVADYNNSNLGVRAISSVMYGNITGNKVYDALSAEYTERYQEVQDNYKNLTEDAAHIATLQGLITKYAQSMLDGTSDETQIIVTDYADGLYNLMSELNESVMKPLGEVYVCMANMLDLLHEQGSHTGTLYSSVDDLLNSVNKLPSFFSQVTVNGRTFSESLKEFASDYKTIQIYTLKGEKEDFSDLTDAEKENSLAYWAYLAPENQVTWSNISKCIEWACSIKTATLNGMKLNELKSALYNGGNIDWDMVGQLTGANNDAVLNNGAIRDLEERIETSMSAPIKVSVKYMMTIDVSATLRTSASDSANWGQVRNEIAYIESLYTGSVPGDQIIAKDTYAMAIDLWLRTNAGAESATIEESEPTTLEDGRTKQTITTTFEQAYLTLEAPEKVIGKEYIKDTITDINGEQQQAYVASYTLNDEAVETTVFFRHDGYYYINETDWKEYNFENELKKQNGGNLPTDLSYTEKVTEKEITIGYQGANRVWSEEQMNGMIDAGDTSSTQGTGSCYVFYANTPADQSRFLELLQSMKVAFIDINGKLRGLAYFDTENYIQESGKVTVPMALSESEAIDLGEELAIMPLNKNEATRLTALIYLDGKQLTNEMVLASGNVQGTINIQFSSSATVATTTNTTITDSDGNSSTITKTDYSSGTDSSAIEEDKMMTEIVVATASITAKDESSGTLTVNIDGIEPKRATAGFIRVINSTQGVLQDYIELSGGDGIWTGEYQFDKPGNYVLRSVKLDGVEYELEEPVSITIEGNAVDSVACDAITDGSKRATVMTSESYVSTNVTLGYASDDQTEKLNGIFRDENGRQVSVKFTDMGSGQWKGTAKFTTDGTYTLEYIEVGEDKDIYPIDESDLITLEIYVGVKAGAWFSVDEATLTKLQSVLTEATATRFVLTDEVSLDVNALIYDNKGEVIKGLSTAILHYGRSGAAVGVSGLDANLTWDAESEYYTGEFLLRKNMAGTYQFSNVEIGSGNLIYSYTEAANIQAMSDGDVAYNSHATKDYQYAYDYGAEMLVNMEYSSAADKIEATLQKGSETYTVVGKSVGDIKANVTQWSFAIPKGSDGTQEGDWQLTSLTAYGVYYEKKYYEQVTFDVSSENITTHVVNKIYVTLDFGTQKPATEIEFMADNIINGMSVTIADYQGNPVGYYNGQEEVDVNISDVRVIYNAPTKTSIEATGYKLLSGSGAEAVSANATLQNGSGTNYTVDDMNFKYAGTYNSASVSFGAKLGETAYEPAIERIYKVNGREVSVVPEYKVQWTKPDVKVTGLDYATAKFNTTTEDVSKLHGLDWLGGWNIDSFQQDVKNWYSNYTAVMYLRFDTSNFIDAYASNLQLTVSDAGDFVNANLTIPNGLGEGKKQSYLFSDSNKSVTNPIGMVENKYDEVGSETSVSAYEVAGENTITKISISADGNTWETDLQNELKINQYGVAPELTFTGLSAYEADGAVTPSTIKTSSSGITLSTDGSSSFTCTLPASQTWSKTYTETKKLSDGSPETVYKYKISESGALWWKETYYDVYELQVTTEDSLTEIYTYVNTYTNNQWKINGMSYQAGSDDFRVEGRWTAEAMPSYERELINTESKTDASGTVLSTSSSYVKRYNSLSAMQADYGNIGTL